MEMEKVEQRVIECRKCFTELTDTNWQPCRKKTNSYICSSCTNKTSKLWKQKNPDKVNQQRKRWFEKNKDKIKQYRQKITKESRRKHVVKMCYNLSWEDYLEFYTKAKGSCSICFKPLSLSFSEDIETAHIDHCHKTGSIRGILCRSCNRGIGYLNDSPERLRKAADYLERNTE